MIDPDVVALVRSAASHLRGVAVLTGAGISAEAVLHVDVENPLEQPRPADAARLGLDGLDLASSRRRTWPTRCGTSFAR